MLEADGEPAHRHHGRIRAPCPPRKAVRPAEEVGLQQQQSQLPEAASTVRGGRLSAKILDLVSSGGRFAWLWEQPRDRCVRSAQFRLTERGNRPAKPPVCRAIDLAATAEAGPRERIPPRLSRTRRLPIDARGLRSRAAPFKR